MSLAHHNCYLPKKVAGDVTNSIVEQLNFEVISISLIHLRGCDEKEVLSNDITCEEAVHLKQFEILHLHRCNKIGIPQFEEEKNHCQHKFWTSIKLHHCAISPNKYIICLFKRDLITRLKGTLVSRIFCDVTFLISRHQHVIIYLGPKIMQPTLE